MLRRKVLPSASGSKCCWLVTSTLKMGEVRSSETSVNLTNLYGVISQKIILFIKIRTHVLWQKITIFSEEPAAFIFRQENLFKCNADIYIYI